MSVCETNVLLDTLVDGTSTANANANMIVSQTKVCVRIASINAKALKTYCSLARSRYILGNVAENIKYLMLPSSWSPPPIMLIIFVNNF